MKTGTSPSSEPRAKHRSDLNESAVTQKYLIFGGSWGSLLALAAAEKHPEGMAGLIVLGISLGQTGTNSQ